MPARNEEEYLPRLLVSLGRQNGHSEATRLRVVLIANNCSDATARVARDFAATKAGQALDLDVVEIAFPSHEAHVGSARRLALDRGAAWLDAQGDPDGILLTTDADAELPIDWVENNIAALAGSDIVGGQIVIAGDVGLFELHADIELYWTAVRAMEDRIDPTAHDPAPRHGDHTGASLAVRAGLYRQIGGLPILPTGEDNALVRRVAEAGGRLRHCPKVHVVVSDRRVGRATAGMAADMKRRAAVVAGTDSYRLPAPSHWGHLLGRRASLRALWRERRSVEAGLTALGASSDDIVAIAPGTCPNEIAFVERADRHLSARDETAPLLNLEDALRAFADDLAAVR